MKKTRQNSIVGHAFKLGALCAVLLYPMSGNAAPISFNFGGSVSGVFGSVFTQNGTGANGFSSALPMSGSFTFNSSTSDSNGSANIGRYNGTIQNLTVTVGNYTATYSPGTSFIRVVNNPGVGSTYHVEVNNLSGPLVNGRAPSAFEITLGNPTGTAFTNDHLPTTPPSLSSFSTNQWRLIFGATGHRVQGALNSLVPLPAAVWLFGAGLIALVGLGSRGLVTRKES